jgi:hypothetical protein
MSMGIEVYATRYTLDERRFENSNTWGFSKKIGEHTFADYIYSEYCNNTGGKIQDIKYIWKITPETRNNVRKVLRTVTDIFDWCGYVPLLQIISGLIRYIAASNIGSVVERKINEGVFVGNLAGEARRTIKAQQDRAFYEMLPIVGSIINLYLDIKWYNRWCEPK